MIYDQKNLKETAICSCRPTVYAQAHNSHSTSNITKLTLHFKHYKNYNNYARYFLCGSHPNVVKYMLKNWHCQFAMEGAIIRKHWCTCSNNLNKLYFAQSHTTHHQDAAKNISLLHNYYHRDIKIQMKMEIANSLLFVR